MGEGVALADGDGGRVAIADNEARQDPVVVVHLDRFLHRPESLADHRAFAGPSAGGFVENIGAGVNAFAGSVERAKEGP